MIIKFKHDSSIKMLQVEGNFRKFSDFTKSVSETHSLPITGYTLYEPTSNTYFKSTDNIPNIENLKIFMTLTTKKVRSGAIDRKALYEEIKNCNLREAIKEHFGRNYTQVSSAELEEFLGTENTSTCCNSCSPLNTSNDFERDVFEALDNIKKSISELSDAIDFLSFKLREEEEDSDY